MRAMSPARDVIHKEGEQGARGIFVLRLAENMINGVKLVENGVKKERQEYDTF